MLLVYNIFDSDVKVGDGEMPSWGDRVVFDWSGYTIGYFGRPFEAKGYVIHLSFAVLKLIIL